MNHRNGCVNTDDFGSKMVHDYVDKSDDHNRDLDEGLVIYFGQMNVAFSNESSDESIGCLVKTHTKHVEHDHELE